MFPRLGPTRPPIKIGDRVRRPEGMWWWEGSALGQLLASVTTRSGGQRHRYRPRLASAVVEVRFQTLPAAAKAAMRRDATRASGAGMAKGARSAQPVANGWLTGGVRAKTTALVNRAAGTPPRGLSVRGTPRGPADPRIRKRRVANA